MSLHPGDAERLETLKLLADSAGDDLESLLDQETQLIGRIISKRAEFAKKRREYEDFSNALAAMGAKA